MRETSEEIAALQVLLDRSHGAATGHLRSIINDDRTLTAQDLVGLLSGMKVLSVATVTARGEPRVSALDGHFLHGTWTFSTSGTSAKGRHLRARPAVSVAHVDGEEMALFAHGQAVAVEPGDPWHDETFEHWIAHYGSDPRSWGEEVVMYRLDPQWMVGYAFERDKLRERRGLAAAGRPDGTRKVGR